MEQERVQYTITAGEAPPDVIAFLQEQAQSQPLRALSDIRAERDRRLTECDWTQLTDAPLTAEQRAAWAAYRQALRDLPQTFENPASVVWPVKPIGEAE